MLKTLILPGFSISHGKKGCIEKRYGVLIELWEKYHPDL
jgi:hypothetical protein